MVRRARVSVVAYVLFSFGACIVAVSVVMGMTTAASFARDRKQARAGLNAAAREVGSWELDGIQQGNVVLTGLAEQASISSLDPNRCASAFEGLESVADQGSVYLLAPDKTVACSLLERRRPVVDVPDGTWFEDVQQTQAPVYAGIVLEQETKTPQVVIAVPVTTDRGTAVLVIALDTAVPPIDVPANSLPKAVFFEVDAARRYVLVTSPHAPFTPGVIAPGAWIKHPLGGSHTQRDPDGIVRMY